MYIRWVSWSILILSINIATQRETVRRSAQLIGAVWSWREANALREAAGRAGQRTQLTMRRIAAQLGRAPTYFARGRIKS
jgi:hypothetical protein